LKVNQITSESQDGLDFSLSYDFPFSFSHPPFIKSLSIFQLPNIFSGIEDNLRGQVKEVVATLT